MKPARFVSCFITLLSLLTSSPLHGQALTRLVTKPIDETRRVTLHGNVHPLAQVRYDLGVIPDAAPAERILLLLNRPAERETALQQFLRDVHTRGSASYHKWITPEQFGKQFGPADSDIRIAQNWLQSKGLAVSRITKGRQFIEFSGTAGQLRSAFHAEIHEYEVNGETHHANASEISIPEALAPLVRGVSPLHDFRAKPMLRVAGEALYSRATKQATPLFTIPNPFGTPNPAAYPLAPEDFATQYNLGPLYQAGVNGTGQTIGIINASNIDISLVNAYRQLFGLSANPTQIVIDGDDPGNVNVANTEAYLDVEVSGSVAPNTTVNLYISNGSALQDPLSLAAIRAVEDNQASVLSASFGSCETGLGNAGNQFWSGLWQQAAAQGQTVFVSSGDTGPECEFALQPSVSGIASTPWNVAVGGTDFFYSDFATGGASATTLWNQTNDSSLGSLKAPLPEQVWDDGFGLNVIANGIQRGEVDSGGGGPSSCVTVSAGQCTGGYAKPSWQIGTGVPSDGVRDLPDVSLFASNGANLSAYPICAFEGECAPGTNSAAGILLIGGTSGSSPAMAGIMALVNQKFGRQGQANFTFYPLAQQMPSAFHDITMGNNKIVCITGTPDCVQQANGFNGTTVYSAAPGYDLASGLGSVDAAVLVNNWNSVTFLPTTTTLALSPAKITHGTPVMVTTSVAPTSGSGTPSGAVAIVTTSNLPASQGQTALTLSGGAASSSVNFFPGGIYNVSADYHGDAVFGSSTSSPVALTVTPENSNINFVFLDGATAVANGGTVQYDDPLTLNIQPVGVSAAQGKTNGNATGTAKFTVDSTNATVALNGVGIAGWTPPALAPGSHTASATYSGDASFNSSNATAISFTVAKGVPFLQDFINAPVSIKAPVVNINTGGSLTVTMQVGASFGPVTGSAAALGTAAPTGTVTVCLGQNPSLTAFCLNPNFSQTAPLTQASGNFAQYATATVTFTNLAAGEYVVSAVYNGDANWQSQGVVDSFILINVGPFTPLPASTTALSITPASISGTQFATVTTTVTGTGSSGVAPTGEVDYFDNGVFLTFDLIPSSTSGNTVSFSFDIGTSLWTSGANQITAIYRGDTNFQSSTSNVVSLTATQRGGDFALAPQISQVTVKAGSSGTVGVNLASLSNFNGSISLTCTPSSSQITCGVSPSPVTVNGSATATLTLNASAQAAALLIHQNPAGWLDVSTGFLLGSVVLAGFAGRKRRLPLLLNVCLFAALLAAVGCGGSGGQGQQPPPPPPPNSATYTVLVTGTANGIVHNAKVTVVVQ